MENRVFGNQEIMAVLVPLLSPLSMIHMFRAIPVFVSLCLRRLKVTPRAFFENRLIRNLMQFCPPNTDVTFLHGLLMQPDMVLTGGFLLATINGDDFDDASDLDLIVPSSFDMWRINNSGFFANVTHTSPGAYQNRHITTIHNGFLSNVRKVQFISISELCPCEATAFPIEGFIDSFDIGFCKSYFSFARGLVMLDTGAVLKRLSVVDIDQAYVVDTRLICHEFLHHTHAPRCYDRLVKYERRGYRLCVKTNPRVLSRKLNELESETKCFSASTSYPYVEQILSDKGLSDFSTLSNGTNPVLYRELEVKFMIEQVIYGWKCFWEERLVPEVDPNQFGLPPLFNNITHRLLLDRRAVWVKTATDF